MTNAYPIQNVVLETCAVPQANVEISAGQLRNQEHVKHSSKEIPVQQGSAHVRIHRQTVLGAMTHALQTRNAQMERYVAELVLVDHVETAAFNLVYEKIQH